jgi:hypothetical protein
VRTKGQPLCNRHRKRFKTLAQLAFAKKYPLDWFDKPDDWRIIGGPLIRKGEPMSNKELVQDLLSGNLVSLARYGATANEIAKNRAFVKRVNEVRNWLNRPGEVRGEVKKSRK